MNNYQQAEARIVDIGLNVRRPYNFGELAELAKGLAQRMDDARAELALFTGAADSYEHLERACALLEAEE